MHRVWFSIFTPQKGDELPEMLTAEERARVIAEMLVLRERFPKLDMRKGLIEQLSHPPATPEDCVFAQTTRTISADLKTSITPCQFGGNPDCSNCGCIASMALGAVANHKLGGVFEVGNIFWASLKIGGIMEKMRAPTQPVNHFPVLRSD